MRKGAVQGSESPKPQPKPDAGTRAQWRRWTLEQRGSRATGGQAGGGTKRHEE